MADRICQAAACLTTALLLLVLRRPCFESFSKAHTAVSIASAVTVWQHTKTTGASRAAFLSLAVFVSSVLFLTQVLTVFLRNWLLRTHCATAKIDSHGSAVVLKVNFNNTFELQPGQFINLWMPALGFRSLLETHPLIPCWTDGNQLEILVRPQRGFSRRLKQFVGEENPNLVWVDGPFGSPPDFRTYETVILVAEGIGLASHLLVMKDLLERYRQRKTYVKSIVLLWKIEASSEHPEHCVEPKLTEIGLQDWVKPWLDELLGLDEDYV